jgi:hypothetical protein
MQSKGVSIGQKFGKNFNTLSNLPGPGQYESSSKRPMSGAKIGKAERNMMSSTSGPGPGAYNCTYNSQKNASKIGSGKRYNMANNDMPGPGSYEISDQHKGGISISGVKNKRNI